MTDKPDVHEDEHECQCAHCRADAYRAEQTWRAFRERPIVWPVGAQIPVK